MFACSAKFDIMRVFELSYDLICHMLIDHLYAYQAIFIAHQNKLGITESFVYSPSLLKAFTVLI